MRAGRIIKHFLAVLCVLLPFSLFAQNSSFSFIYEGPTELFVDEDCFATLDWGHPNTPVAISNLPQGEIVSFDIFSISGGFMEGDAVPPGNVVTILYQATDNFGNTALFGFSITIVDNFPPEFVTGTLPADLEVGCIDDVPPPADVMATDNCMDAGFQFTISFSEEGTADPCTGGLITRTWVADDDLGNQSTYIQTITVLPDTTDPVITVPPLDGSGACENAMALYTDWLAEQRANFTAEDAGCGDVTYSDNAPDPGVLVEFCGVVPVLFSAVDDCGNTTTITATFSILNETPPTITTEPEDAMASCASGNPQAAFQAWISNHAGADAVDDCGSVQWSTNPENPSILDTCVSEYQIEFIADDGCGNTTSVFATFTVIDTTGPTITAQAQNRIVTCSSSDVDTELATWLANAGNAAASDLCTNTDDLMVEYMIGGIALDSAGVFGALQDSIETGCRDGVIIGGIIFNNMLALLEVEFIFRDKCGNGTGTTALFGLLEGLPPEIIAPASSVNLACDITVSLEDAFTTWYESAGGAVAEDDCGAVLWRGEPGMEEAFTQLSAALDTACGEDAVVEVRFFAQDYCGLESDTFTAGSFGIIDTLPPTLVSPATDLIASCEEGGIELLVNWLDTRAGAVAEDDCASLQWQFRFVGLNGDTLTGTPGLGPYPEFADLDCAAPTAFQFIASDFCGNSLTTTANFLLLDTIPPMISFAGDTLTVSCENIPTIDDITVSDNCSTGMVEVGFEDSVSGDTSEIDCAGFLLQRIWTATDACGNMGRDTIYLFISDEMAPVFTPPADITIRCEQKDSIPDIPPTDILDNCDPSPEVAHMDSIDTAGCLDKIFRTWMVSDACGNLSTSVQVITLVDTLPPVFTACPDTVTIALDPDTCAARLVVVAPEVEDHCAGQEAIQLAYSLDGGAYEMIAPGDSMEYLLFAGSHLLEWEAVDCSGNTGNCTTSIFIDDPVSPEIICPGGFEVKVEDSCTQVVHIPLPQNISDNCPAEDLVLTVMVSGATEIEETEVSMEADSMPVTLNTGISMIRYVVLDPFGNSDTCTFEVMLTDELFPEAVCQDIGIVIDPDGVEDVTVSASDLDGGSSDNCGQVTFSTDQLEINCSQIGTTLQAVLTVTDAAGNQSTCNSTIEVSGPEFLPGFSLSVCTPDTLRLFAFPPGDNTAYAYAWTGPAGFTSTLENPLITGVDTSNSGTYVLTITGQSGCSLTDSFDVTVSETNIPVISPQANVFCEGDTILLSASMYAEEVQYIWFLGTFPGGMVVDTTDAPALVLTAGDIGSFNYYLVVSSADCEIGPSDAVPIEVFGIPEAMLQVADTAYCTGDSIYLQSLNNAADIEFTWSGPGNFSSKLKNPEPFEAMPGASGEYMLFVTQNGCVSATESVVLQVSDPPGQPLLEGKDLYCLGGALDLEAQVESSVDSFVWLSPDGLTFTTMGGSLAILESFPGMAGLWNVIAYTNDCPSDTSAGFEVNFEMTEGVMAVNSGPVCIGEDVTIGLSQALEGAQYAWTGPDNFESDLAENLVSPAVEGTYTVFILTAGGCQLDLQTEVQLIPMPEIDTILANYAVCADGVNGGQLIPQITSQGQAAVTYAWTGPGIASTDSVLVIDSLDAARNGWYVLRVSEGGCAPAVDSFLIQVTDIPEQPEVVGDLQWCEGDTLVLVSGTPYPPGTGYTWNTPQGEVATPSPRLELPDIGPAANGAYSLTVQVDECTSAPSVPIQILVIESIPTPVIVAETSVCEGDTIFLAVEGGINPEANYLWTGPDGFSAATAEPFIFPASGLASGNYFVELEIGPCRSNVSDAFFIEIIPRPATPSIETDLDGICLDDPVAKTICLDDGTLTEGAVYTWFAGTPDFPLGETQSGCFDLIDFTSFSEGSNSLLVQAEANGCTSFLSAAGTFEGFRFPDEEAQIEGDLVICQNETPIVMAAPVTLATGIWSSEDGLLDFDSESNSTTQVFGLSEGENRIIWTLSYEACVNYSADTGRIFVEPLPMLQPDTIAVEFGQTSDFNVVLNDLTPAGYTLGILRSPVRGNALYRGDGDFVFTPDIGFVGTDSLVYEICSETCPDQCASVTAYLIVGDENDCFVPTIFTPNEDGVNDAFVIPCLEAERYPANRVIIFNQWGDEVFSASPYRNDWRGTRKGNDLPVSTYYYIVDFGDGTPVRKGFLVLER